MADNSFADTQPCLNTPEIAIDFPSKPIRIGENSVGLLACRSSARNCLPSTEAPVAQLFRSSLLTVAGPRRISTGFPYNTEAFILYGKAAKSVKDVDELCGND